MTPLTSVNYLRSGRQYVAALGLTLVAFIVLASSASAESAPIKDPDPARFESEIAAFEAWDRQNSFPPDAVLFVGSSSIRFWPTAESFPGVAVINRGFGGSHASDVVHFAGRIVFKYKPQTIVFYAGDNDIADGKSPQQVADDFGKFATLVHERLPAARIIYLPIKPSPSRWQKWPQAKEVNELVAAFIADKPWVKYVDTATPLLGTDGQPKPELYRDDCLHLNDDGYKLWNEVLLPVLTNGAATN
jgi:lysophospholipase L1-like esterase